MDNVDNLDNLDNVDNADNLDNVDLQADLQADLRADLHVKQRSTAPETTQALRQIPPQMWVASLPRHFASASAFWHGQPVTQTATRQK